MALAAEPELDIQALERVQRRVLWLATSIVHHANRVRENRSGVKVGGHQASSASMVSLMTALWSWLMQRLGEISAKSSLAGAIRYTLGHWEGLTQFLSDGRIEVDNNTVERGIRPIPLGRKNILFAGNDSGGERWAILSIGSIGRSCFSWWR